jgi:DNA polymerase-1
MLSNKKRLVILDSHAILHRAYHAMPDFTSKSGEPTGALYGLVTTILKIVSDLKPDYVVACRDLPGPTHRHEAFEGYKATRAQVEDTLIAQLERAPKVFEAFGIPMYSAAGFEADDCIGTIVKQIEGREDLSTTIASGDMDILQLVSESVRVYTFRKGINDTVLYDTEVVHERYGFGPERIVDYKALRGDPSDNIPGIKGIGEKTATDLIVAFGSVDDIYATLENKPEKFAQKVKPRIIELLKNGKNDAYFSRELATIHSGAPITFAVPEKEWDLANVIETAYAMCDELEFRALKERLRMLVQKKAGKRGAYVEDADGGETMGLFADEPQQQVDEKALKETAIALWLIHSDLTNPTLTDILDFAKTKDFEKAREAVFKRLHETGRLSEVFEQIERPLIPIVERMNAAGISLDTHYLSELAREYTTELERIAADIYRDAGHEFNINSPKQLGVVLYDELKIMPEKAKKTAGGARTTREDELAKLAEEHPIIEKILGYRELQKLLSTYIEKMPELVDEHGRLHTEFLQAGTTTGRIASQNPNVQNIPTKTEYGRRVRNAFVAPKGRVLVAIDYSQIELRLAAGLSGDEKLVHVFQTGGDVHTAVAKEVFRVPGEVVDREMRRRAKVINFGILYGMGVNALRVALGGGVSRDDAAKFLSNYFTNFPGLERYIAFTKTEAAGRGYTETLFGRRRYFPGFKSSLPGLRAQAERMAINAPMQGTQADIIKIAMVQADNLIEKKGWREKAKLVLQVHDELIYEMDEATHQEMAQDIRKLMEDVVAPEKLCGVPIVAELSVGYNWGELKRQ